MPKYFLENINKTVTPEPNIYIYIYLSRCIRKTNTITQRSTNIRNTNIIILLEVDVFVKNGLDKKHVFQSFRESETIQAMSPDTCDKNEDNKYT